MDTGLDTPQIRAVKKTLAKALHDPGQLRLIVSCAIGLLGLFAMVRPEADRLEAARAEAEKLEATAEDADELKGLVQQSDSYVGRLPKVEDIGGWQDYITSHLEAAGVTMRKIEPRKSLQSGPFRVIVFEVTVEGMYPQLVDLLDRIERGERVARLDRVSFEKHAGGIGMRFQILGLVKLRA